MSAESAELDQTAVSMLHRKNVHRVSGMVQATLNWAKREATIQSRQWHATERNPLRLRCHLQMLRLVSV